MSFYRPRYDGPLRYDDSPPSPPSSAQRPRLQEPPPTSNGEWLNGDSWRPNTNSHHQFTFRHSDTTHSFPQEPVNYQRHAEAPGRERPRRHDRRRDAQNLNPARRGNHNRSARGPRDTSNRPLLQRQHEDNTDNMEVLGVTEGTTKYLNVGDFDDTESEDMDQSDSDQETGEIMNEGFDGTSDEKSVEPPAKRRDMGEAKANGDSRPQWSNPDPYFVLPPIDETVGKRKDPVEKIRKYRKIEDAKLPVSNQVTSNDDYISFNMEPDVLEGEETLPQENDGLGVVGAPTAPRQMRGTQFEDNNSLQGQGPPDDNFRSLAADGQSTGSRHVAPLHSSNDIANEEPRESQNHYARIESRVPLGQIILDIEDEVEILGVEGVTALGDISHPLRGRKRTHDSYLRNDNANERTQLGLLQTWRPKRGSNPVPWLNLPQYVTVNPGFRLHMEICDFFDFVKPQKFEETVRISLLNRLQSLIEGRMPNCTVQCFGSFAAGLYLPNADMDVVVLSENYIRYHEAMVCQNNKKLYAFSDMIRQSGIAKHGSVDVVAHAKVPLVKFVDRLTNLRIDMSFENDSGLIAIETFRKWKREHPAMPLLVTLIKQFLLMRGLNEVQHGGIGGFSVTCLVTSLLQNMPRVQTGELIPEAHIGEILLEFLDFYGNRFDVSRTGIEMEPPGYFDKHAYNRPRFRHPGFKTSQPDRIAIMDPNKRGNDISGGSRMVLHIFALFAKAHKQILEAMKARDRPSLLDWMLGGDYTDVMAQRTHMKALHDGSPYGTIQASHENLSNVALAPAVRTYTATMTDRQSPESHNMGNWPASTRQSHPMANGFTEITKMQKGPMIKVQESKQEQKVLAPENGAQELHDYQSQRSRAQSLKARFPEAADRIPNLLDRKMYDLLSVKFTKKGVMDVNDPKGSKARAKSLKKKSSASSAGFSAPLPKKIAKGLAADLDNAGQDLISPQKAPLGSDLPKLGAHVTKAQRQSGRHGSDKGSSCTTQSNRHHQLAVFPPKLGSSHANPISID